MDINNFLKNNYSREIEPEINLTEKKPLLSFISDENLSLAIPIILYWIYALFFHFIDVNGYWDKYRIHTPEEITRRNKATFSTVIKGVLVQQFMQTLTGVILFSFDPPELTGYEANELWHLEKKLNKYLSNYNIYILYQFIIPCIKIFLGYCVIDTWQYFWHRTMHVNKTLYRKIHSHHHRLYIPFAAGALYNHPLEGLILDTAGAGVAMKLCRLTLRESMIMFGISTLKTVDDHCGYKLPFDPLQLLFQNNASYHDIHHQNFGIKHNYSQPFFIVWDKWLGTEYKGVIPDYKHLSNPDKKKDN